MEHLIDLMIELLTHRQIYLSKHVYKIALPSRGCPSFNLLIVITNLSQANQPLSQPQTHHISVRIHSSVFTPPTQGNTIRVQLHCFPDSEDIHYISYQHSPFFLRPDVMNRPGNAGVLLMYGEISPPMVMHASLSNPRRQGSEVQGSEVQGTKKSGE